MKIYEKRLGKSHVSEVEISFDKNYDVVVAGLGAAGSFAAIAAAEEGVSVLGIERTNGVGGMCTQGSVLGYYYGFTGGKFEEVDKETRASTDVFAKFGLHPDAKQYSIDKLIRDTGVETLFSSVILGIYFEGDKAVGARVLTPDGVLNIGSKILIDATSEGHVVSMTDNNVTLGRATDGKTVPFTSMLGVKNPDGRYDSLNRDHGYCNQYDAYAFSKKIIEAHSHNTDCVNNPNRNVLYVAPQIGVREGYRIEGEETLTLSDVLEAKDPEKTLVYAYSDVDKHGHDNAVDTDLYQDWWVVSNLATVTAKIPVPLGAVVPKGKKGIFSCGRCLSVDGYVSAAVRMNRDMFRLGEAEGVAAAMCVKSGKELLEIDYNALKENLQKRGCFDPSPEIKFGFDWPGKNEPYRKVEWFTNAKDMIEVLSTETPGVAIWSARALGKTVANDLFAAMETAQKGQNELLAYNCALSLGIIGDTRALPVLREIAEKRSAFYFKDCRRSNQFRSVAALCLLGRLLDKESFSLLEEIVFSPTEIEKPLYHELEPSYLYYNAHGFNFVYFQHFTQAAVALAKIAKAYPALAIGLKERFETLFSDEAYIRKVTQKGKDTSEYREIKDTADYVLNLLG